MLKLFFLVAKFDCNQIFNNGNVSTSVILEIGFSEFEHFYRRFGINDSITLSKNSFFF